MADKRWLTLRGGQTWHCIIGVPRPLRAILGKSHLIKSLHTTDLPVARQRRWQAVAEFQAIISKARGQDASPDLIATALAHRAMLDRYAAGDLRGFHAPAMPDEYLQAAAIDLALDDAESIAERYGPAMARTFIDVATGTGTPLLHHMESWLTEGGKKGKLAERTTWQYRTSVQMFAKWCEASGVPATVEAVTKPVVGRFIGECFVAKGIDPGTSNRRIAALQGYWTWMGKRVGVAVNPWTGQTLAKVSAREGDRTKRPFTDAELALLLSGNAGEELSDAIRVAALSGMRLEEIYQLRVADCAGDEFNIRKSKSAAGVRRVPIHTGLAGVVARRVAGKAATGYLFHEPTTPASRGGQRSGAMSQMFGRYRIRLGVHEREDGRRHSRVDFHSLRRWMITQCRQAGIDQATVAAVVGHEVGNLTDDVYSSGPSKAQRRACVESVKLPAAFCGGG
jgi:integrase